MLTRGEKMTLEIDDDEQYILIRLLKDEKSRRALGETYMWHMGPLIEKISGKLYDTSGT